MSTQPLNVIHKADEILELLVRNDEMTIAELAEASGEPRTSLYRLMGTLEELGFVEPGRRENTFALGVYLFRLGNLVSSRFAVRQAALGPMEHLFERTGETVFLMVRHRFEAICIERLDGRRVQSMVIDLGGSLPLHLGAGPLVLLAHAPARVKDAYLAQPSFVDYTEKSVVDPHKIAARLGEVRSSGYAVSDEDLVPGIAALGAPILDSDGRILAALSISGAKPTILAEGSDLLQRVRDAAAEISASSGLTEDPGRGEGDFRHQPT